MPAARLAAPIVALLGFVGCGDGAAPARTPAPAAPAAAAPGPATPAAPAPAAATPVAPARPRATPEQLAGLANRDVPGFRRTSQRSGKSNAVVTFEGTTPNAQGFRPVVQVVLEHCTFCAALDVATWRANDNLRRTLSSVHLENPALVFEVDALDLLGHAGIGVWKESFVETKRASGTTRSSAHGLAAWFNDGVHQLMIDVSARGPALPGSLEELRRSMGRDEMEAAARAVFAAYADLF